MSVLAAMAHKAYWQRQGCTDAEIEMQWTLGVSMAAWEDAANAVKAAVAAPADERIRELEQQLAKVRDLAADLDREAGEHTGDAVATEDRQEFITAGAAALGCRAAANRIRQVIGEPQS